MSDEIRRLLEQQEALRRITDPLGGLQRQIDEATGANLQRQLDVATGANLQRQIDLATGTNLQREVDQARQAQLGIGSEVMRFMEQEEQRRKLLYGIGGGYHSVTSRIAEEAERNLKLLQGPIEEARRLGLLDPSSELRRSMTDALAAREAYEQMFRRPELHEISRLARDTFAAGSLAATASQALKSAASLEAAMGAMRSPWLSVEHAERSAHAFAEMQALGRTLSDHAPFDAALVTSVRASLGDWRDPITQGGDLFINPMLRSGFYLERGFDPALTDFTWPAFEESLDIAGLGDARESDEGDTDSDGLARARSAFGKLQEFEVAIRRFIERVMQAAYGDDWMRQQLPTSMLDKWRAKRETAVKAGEVAGSLIDYADFTDYRQIIERRDNWNAVFKPIFGRAEDVRESLQRLYPLRIATMHARIVTPDDQLLLTVETRRVLSVIQTWST